MTVNVGTLRQSDFVANSETDLFVAATRSIIDKCSSSAVLAGSVTIRIIESGGTTGLNKQQAKKYFQLDESYTWPEIVGQVLEAGDKITGVCTAASAVTCRISGRKIS